ncbi:MAG: hypothetical protein ONB30_13600 [candidate division KSB1 bacterium]|nr:hypothetical protein [candidate division KSB1 bacterium]
MRLRTLPFWLASLLMAAVVTAQTTSKIDGVIFGDYYYNLKNHSSAEKDRNAFAFRRIYFTFENNITDAIKVRFRLESESEKFGTEKKINPFVKHAFLQWTGLIPRHDLFVGMIETNAFKNSEELWAYRSIEKTIMDLNKISSSADMGVALKGDLLGTRVHHWLGIYNGSGYGSAEVDRFKKVGYALWFTPVRGMIIEGYADYENLSARDPQTAVQLSSAKDYRLADSYHTLKAFVGYDHPRFSLGAEVFQRTNSGSGIKEVVVEQGAIKSSTKADVQRFGYSLFGYAITPLPRLKAFARYDYYDPNTSSTIYTKFTNGTLLGGEQDEEQLLIAGLDYIPVAGVHVMPNVLIKKYSKEGVKDDLTVRLTLSYNYNSGKIVVE